MATSVESPNNEHNQSTPENPLNMAGDRSRVNDAVHLQSLVKGRKYLDALTNAETKAAYGDLFNAPDGDEMIAVDSNFKTEHHYHAPTKPEPKPLPAWAKALLLAAGVAGTGGAGYWLATNNKPPGTPAATERSWELDFWQPDTKSQS